MRNSRLTERLEGLEQAAEKKDAAAFAELVAALSDSSPTIRAAAAEYLGTLGSAAAVRPLLHRLSDRFREVRLRVTEALGVVLDGSRECPVDLLAGLRDSDEIVRVETVQTIERIHDPKVLPQLRRAINDRSPLVRGYAASAIARLGGIDQKTFLRTLLNDEHSPFVRAGIYEGLHVLGEPDALPDLLRLMDSPDSRTRCAVANILAALEYTEADKAQVVREIDARLKEESTVAARSALLEAKQQIEG